MPWWVGLIFGLVLAVMALVIYLLARKAKLINIDRSLLQDSERKALQKEIEAERQARKKLDNAARQLVNERNKIEEWYNGAREALDEATRKRYEELAGDPGALDGWLDGLGIPSASAGDETKPP
jgi:predicted Holliday junction resolvase-like endonuclease